MWLSSLEIGAARRIFTPLPTSRQNHRSYVWTEARFRYSFGAGTKAIQYSVSIALVYHSDPIESKCKKEVFE